MRKNKINVICLCACKTFILCIPVIDRMISAVSNRNI